MDTIFKAINKNIRFFNMACNKIGTGFALKVTSKKPVLNNVAIKTNVSYGKNKLQKYDVLYPTNITGNLPVVFYIHGGSWCAGDKYGYNSYLAELAKQGYVCVNINYRLLPKVSLQVTMLDCIRAIKHFAGNNAGLLNEDICTNLNQTFLVGDSAGAHLVSLIAGQVTTNKFNLGIQIVALGLYYGVYDFNNLAIDPSGILRETHQYLKLHTKNLKLLCKKISPTTYVNANYPPCFITAGKIDKLYYQTSIMLNLLKLNGVEHKALIFEKDRKDGLHAFLNLPKLETSKQAFAELCKFFKTQLTGNL